MPIMPIFQSLEFSIIFFGWKTGKELILISVALFTKHYLSINNYPEFKKIQDK